MTSEANNTTTMSTGITSAFPEPTIFDPLPNHTHTNTLILLHGRGSSGPEFSAELFSIDLTPGTLIHQSQSHPQPHTPQTFPTLRSSLPTWRFVFPSSPCPYSTTFQEYLPSWFNAPSLTDTSLRKDLQLPGLFESVRYVRRILDSEVRRIGNDASKVFLGGISQGGAVALWVLLSLGVGGDMVESRIGGFVGACCWLPLCEDLDRWLTHLATPPTRTTISSPSEDHHSQSDTTTQQQGDQEDYCLDFVKQVIHPTLWIITDSSPNPDLKENLNPPRPPILLTHGIDDAYVPISHATAASQTLSKALYTPVLKTYSGAEDQGHWFKEPEQVDDILDFLRSLS